MFSVALCELSSHRVGFARTGLSIGEDSLVESVEQAGEHRLNRLVVNFRLLDGISKYFVVGKLATTTVDLRARSDKALLCP